MPGIVGLVQSDGADVSEIVAASARKLLHLDTLTMRSGTFDGVGLAQVWRDEPRPDRDWVDEPATWSLFASPATSSSTVPRRAASTRAHWPMPTANTGAFPPRTMTAPSWSSWSIASAAVSR